MSAEPDERSRAVPPGETARAFFEELWSKGDTWELDASALDQARYARQVALLDDRHYRRALEIGCAAGSFTRHLAPLCDRIVALDIAEAAVAAARAAGIAPDVVEFRQADVMEFDAPAEGPWDLVVLAETAYYLGWLHPLFAVGWLAHSLREGLAPDGRLLLVNTIVTGDAGSLMSPWLVATYRDLFVNVGYVVDHEETLRGDKHGVTFDVLLTRFSCL